MMLCVIVTFVSVTGQSILFREILIYIFSFIWFSHTKLELWNIMGSDACQSLEDGTPLLKEQS